eukprot:12564541-Ditylum_brightwellii.AAC.1
MKSGKAQLFESHRDRRRLLMEGSALFDITHSKKSQTISMQSIHHKEKKALSPLSLCNHHKYHKALSPLFLISMQSAQ